jgi:MOSC domain-containing protein YiiM
VCGRRPTRDGGQIRGGLDQAVYAFPAVHFDRLGQLAGSSVGPGFMGENLTVSGVTEHDVRIGDVWAWGPARLQVTAPRGPCYKLGIRMGKQAARTGKRLRAGSK